MTLRIGMPSGSLADPKRGGNLIDLLEASGFKTSGYEAGGPTKFTTVNFLYGWDGRPQEFGSQLGLEELDIAIAGDDWIKERVLELDMEYGVTLELERVLPLGRGAVRLVGIADAKNPANTAAELLQNIAKEKKLITAVTEMPYITLDWIRSELAAIGLADKFALHSVQKYRTPSKIEEGILIYETWGKTEAKVKNGGADLGLEITQSGSALKNYGLKIVSEVLQSEASIWVNPAIRENAEKYRLARMLLVNLYGTINAEGKVLVIFNIENGRSADLEKYLSDNHLFGDEPTVNRGLRFTEYSIQVDCTSKELPLAKVRFELAELGAKHIDTLPIRSSIPSLDVLGW